MLSLDNTADVLAEGARRESGARWLQKFTPGSKLVLLACLYALLGYLGRAAARIDSETPFVWPPFGLSLAALLLLGINYWPGVALGGLLLAFLIPGQSVIFALSQIIGNTMGTVLCVYLLRRSFQLRLTMESVRDVAGFILLACGIGTSLNAAFNAAAVAMEDPAARETMFDVLLRWWMPTAMAGLILTPFLIVWATRPAALWSTKQTVEGIICGAGLILGTLLSFRSWYVQGIGDYALAYLPVPFLVWGSLRFGLRGAATGTLLISVVAISETLQMRGPFVMADKSATLILLGTYVCVLAILNLLLAAAATEKAVALERLAISERRYRAIVEDQTEMVWRFKPDGTLTFVNRAYCKFHERDSPQLLGTKFLPMLPEEDREIPLAYFQTLPAEAPMVSYDLRLVLPSGQISWQQCTTRRLVGADGGTIEFQSVARDITQRKQNEEALREAEHRQRVILNSMPDAVLVLDQSAGITSANPAAEKMLGQRAERIVGRSASDFLVDPGALNRALASEGSRARIIATEILDSQGQPVPVELGISPAFLKGKPLWIAVLRDVRERKAFEQQIRQSQKMEVLGRLAGGIAHDFNNLIQAVMGFANILAMRLPHEDANRKIVLEIERTADRAKALTSQLLAFSRKQLLEPRVVSANAVVTDLSRMLRRLLRDDIELQLSLIAPRDHVRVDPSQLEQVIMNLAVNARDAMPDGGVLQIQSSQLSFSEPTPVANIVLPAGDWVVLSVVDSGFGMTSDIMAKLFEPFFTTKGEGKGTGLGLSIVYGIVKQSGGEIGVESKPGAGTQFRVFLPRVEEAVEETVFIPKPVERTNAPHERVLVVEDEELLRALLVEILTSFGYTVEEAPDGQAALRLLEREEYQLLITDLSMPKLSGPVLAERVREILPSLKILFISGLPEDELTPLLRTNTTWFLQKPFRGAALLEKVREIFSEEQPPAS